jgi:hypothetical protein
MKKEQFGIIYCEKTGYILNKHKFC